LHTCGAGNSTTDASKPGPVRYVTLILSVAWMYSPWPTWHTCGAGNSTTDTLGPFVMQRWFSASPGYIPLCRLSGHVELVTAPPTAWARSLCDAGSQRRLHVFPLGRLGTHVELVTAPLTAWARSLCDAGSQRRLHVFPLGRLGTHVELVIAPPSNAANAAGYARYRSYRLLHQRRIYLSCRLDVFPLADFAHMWSWQQHHQRLGPFVM
jgi:hypothetical protein